MTNKEVNAARTPRTLRRTVWVFAAVFVGLVAWLRFGTTVVRQHADKREIERIRDPEVPMDERKAIAIAMRHFADGNGGEPIDAQYWATREPDGFRVFVEFVVGRDFIGNPRYRPGGHCTLNVSNDGQIGDILGGL